MAQIKIYRDERDDLPNMCACCAETPLRRVRKTFAWYPPWVNLLVFAGVLPYLILISVLTKRMMVPVPLCPRHVNHWRLRTSLAWGVLAAVFALYLSGVTLNMLEVGPGPEFVCSSVLVALLAWLTLVFGLHFTSIRPTKITDESITLTDVSREFADAVRQQQQEADDEAEEYWQERKERPGPVEPPSTDIRE